MQNTALFFSTYARVILNDWQVVAALIKNYGRSINSLHDTESKENPLLDSSYIKGALTGPYHIMFGQLLAAFTTYARTKLELKFREEEVFKKEKSPNYADAFSETQMAGINGGTLVSIEKQLTDKVSEYNHDWHTLLEKSRAAVLDELTHNAIEFSDMEVKEFDELETLADLYKRFTDLSIQPFKSELVEQADIADYLTLKAHIAIYSSLGRRQVPNDASVIEKYLKTLKAVNKQITVEEQALAEKQKTELATIIKSIDFAKLVTTRSK